MSPSRAEPYFTDATASSGLVFTHVNGMTGEFLYPEVMPPGVALFDYDADGDLDVFAPQGRPLKGAPGRPPAAATAGGRLFRNELDAARGPSSLRFTDVTAASGLVTTGYGMGVAAGDYNNDGCIDLYVTSLGANQLFRNQCDGTFADATQESGAADSGWSVPAAFVDIDRDGWLDLFVGHYLNYSVASNIDCFSLSGQPDYCPPHVYRAQPDRLFRNNGNGTFTDVTTRAGVAGESGPALGVASADFDGDGWIDIYVANDGVPNTLWLNKRDGTFSNTALLGGAAVSPEGLAKASMGVDAGDFDNDGDEDLFIGELTGQGADLYVNDGSAMFTDASARAGLRVKTLPFTGFGAAWLDIDHDGLLDLAVVNGAVTHTAEALARKETFALAQRKQLFRNTGTGTFEEVSDRGGAAFALQEVSRGAAFGDVDNDGDADILVGNDNGPLRLLLGSASDRGHWIGLRLLTTTTGAVRRPDAAGPAVGGPGSRDALGARVAITRADGVTLWRRARADGSYASASDPRVLAGLGASAAPASVRVLWPDGTEEQWDAVGVDRYTTLRKGAGRPTTNHQPPTTNQP